MSLVLAGGRLPGRDVSVDITVREGRIAAIAPADARMNGDRVDLDGRFVTPGLWDNHVHFTQWVLRSRRLDLGSARSAVEAAGLVAERVKAGAAEVVAAGFRDALWPDEPLRQVLDAAAGDVPVVAVSADLHSAWLNSPALRDHGFPSDADGLLRERDAFTVVGRLESVSTEVTDGWAIEAAAAAAERGVVGVVDLEMEWNLEAWSRRMAEGFDGLRVEFGVYPQHLQRAISLGLQSGQVIEATGGLLTVGPFKVITDGSLNTRTAYCFDAYPGLDGEDRFGLLTVSPAELVPLLESATRGGLRVAVHAIGDHANTLALDAIERAGARGSIEHAQLLSLSDIARFARLGVTASVQPEHAMDDRDVADRYWPGRTDRAFPLAALHAAGVALAFGSDAPVAPLDPWVSIAAAVGRSRDGRAAWHPEQAIDAAVALEASSRTRVAEGEPADLAILERDPLSADPEGLREMPVAATLLGGRFTHRAL
ncbi:amidohydrolase family protein [Rathayibacter sp. YIM 133350]|uniref:amidohydrolase n=1 Tax=Rathayibacter sp. YIM 133350 TaxID=3131992 RepID=UPI00307D3F21